MGDGLTLTANSDAAAITDGLTDLFKAKLGRTKAKFDDLTSNTYKHLFKHDAAATGSDRRQRSLRHAAWLLTAEIFADQNPHTLTVKFRLWLRYLTWIERAPPAGAVVKVNGVVNGDSPAKAMLDTLWKAMDRTKQVEFHWDLPDNQHPGMLTVEVQNVNEPYSISVWSIMVSDLDNIANYTALSDSEDDF